MKRLLIFGILALCLFGSWRHHRPFHQLHGPTHIQIPRPPIGIIIPRPPGWPI